MVLWSWSGAAVLFDMDGTLVDSGASVLRAWQWTAERLDLPFSVFAPYLHGIPADQVLARVASFLPKEVRASVVEEMLARQAADTSGIVAVPGAARRVGSAAFEPLGGGHLGRSPAGRVATAGRRDFRACSIWSPRS